MRFRLGDRFIPRLRKINIFAKKSENELTNVELLPQFKNGEEHPMPYYKSGEITLDAFTGPPWKEDDEREAREKFKKMMTDPKIARHFRDAFLKETLDEEIMAAASSFLAERKNERRRDEAAVIIMEEELLVPTVQRQVFVSVWQLLYDWGRNLPVEEFQALRKREKQLKMEESHRNALNAFMFDSKGKSSDLKVERQLSGYKWDCLLYNYHAELELNSFKENVALHILQEDIVSKAGADEVMSGVLSYLEQDMVNLDEKEKVESPPRKG